MQKILATTLAAAVSIMLITGCGGSGEVVDTTTPAETTTQEPEATKATKPVAKPVEETVSKTGSSEVTAAQKNAQAMSAAAKAKLSEMTRIYFEFDKAQITSGAADTLKQNAAILKAVPGVKVIIEGHCDERGTTEYNLALGERRASAVKQFLVDTGADAGRLTTISKGEEEPAASGSDEQAWAKNRRAEFKVAK